MPWLRKASQVKLWIVGGAVDKTGRDKIIRIAAFDVSKNERTLKLMCSCGFLLFVSMASWNRNKQFWLVYVNSMIQTWAQPMSTSSYSDRKAQFTNGRCHQSTLRASCPIQVCVCVCARVKLHQLFCSSVSNTPPFLCGIFMGDSFLVSY